jgi:YD repeat-containing protein
MRSQAEHPLSSLTAAAYDAFGRLVSSLTAAAYDAFGRLVSSLAAAAYDATAGSAAGNVDL